MSISLHNVYSASSVRLAMCQVNQFNGDLRVSARFWAKVRDGAAGECWPWTASVQPSGYGQFAWSARFGRSYPAYAHRTAWELTNGAIPDGKSVLHHCDNPPCCNPAHLFVGTQIDNMRDAAAKGRLSVRHAAYPRVKRRLDDQLPLSSITAGVGR